MDKDYWTDETEEIRKFNIEDCEHLFNYYKHEDGQDIEIKACGNRDVIKGETNNEANDRQFEECRGCQLQRVQTLQGDD